MVIRSKRMRWRSACKMRNAYTVLVRKSEGDRSLGRESIMFNWV
jgi:hypothetical protein